MSSEKTRIRFGIYRDEVLVEEREVDQHAVKIGRLSTHHVALDDEDVGVTHAVLQVTGGAVTLFALDTSRPTLLNGDPVNKCKVKSGDIIQVGPFRLVTEIAAGEPRSKAAVPPPAPGPMRPAPSAGLKAAAPGALPGMAAVPGMPAPAAGVRSGMTEAERTAAAARLIDLNKIEDASSRILEVIPVWQNTVFDVKHLTGRSRSFAIGEEPGCDFWVPAEQLGGDTRVVIADGSSIRYPAFMQEGEVTLESGERRPLENGTYQVPDDAQLSMKLGDVSFLVNSVPAPRKPKLPIATEWSYHSFNGASMLGVMAALFMVFFFPPNSMLLSTSELENDSIYHRFLMEPHEIIPQDELPEFMTKKDEQKDEKEGGTGERHKGDEGQMGDVKNKKTDNMYGIKGPEENPDPHMARDQKKDMAQTAGILSVLDQSLSMPTSPFGRDSALGNDAESALGALMGSQIGPNFGFGGLGLIGTGSGGGGTGENTIGLGKWGKIGHGAGYGKGVGFGHGDGGLKGHHKGKVPPPITGKGTVKGSLSKEAIRRVIRQHLNEVRFCYEQGLSSQPDLEGRVTVAFLISPAGTVQCSSVPSSTLGAPKVDACIAKAVRRWTFPSPEDGGVVFVKYPFMLKPASSD